MLKIGKLDSKLLEGIVFKSIHYKRPEVLKRPGIGEDCAVVDFGDYECVMSTDPISAAVSQIGRLAVHISCNDIASNGVEPLGIMLAVMLPEGTTEEEVAGIMAQAGETAASLGVEIIGGHTEITSAVNRPVIVSTAIGRWATPKNAIEGDSPSKTATGRGASSKTTTGKGKMPKGGQDIKDETQNGKQGIKPGDLIFMTKSAGLEGSGIIACDCGPELHGKLSAAEIDEAKSYLDMVSVVEEGVAAGKIGYSGMHDVTEGGILGAVWELCHASGTGAEIWHEAIPVSAVTEKICGVFGIDPLRLISSGCMLIITPAENKERMIDEITGQGITINLIGEVKETGEGILMTKNGIASEIMPPESDELYKALA